LLQFSCSNNQEEDEKSCQPAAFFLKNGTVFPVHTWQFGCMDKNTNKEGSPSGPGRHEHPLPQEISIKDKKLAEAAHDAADRDMENDAELTASSPNDDLDEGELARLGDDKT
jgi:hypothetical protein